MNEISQNKRAGFPEMVEAANKMTNEEMRHLNMYNAPTDTYNDVFPMVF